MTDAPDSFVDSVKKAFEAHREASKIPPVTFGEEGAEIGRIVDSKQVQYGDAAGRSAQIFKALYPTGIRPDQYRDALLVVRILDKLSRIAQRGNPGVPPDTESPYRDIAGYGLLGAREDSKAF